MKIFSVVNLSMESPQSDSIIHSPVDALSKIKNLLTTGADFVDIGGRSSGSKTTMISAGIEQARLAAVFQLIREQKLTGLSLDTWSAETALTFLNDVEIINYTSTHFPDNFLSELANTGRKLILSYLPAENPYALRTTPCLMFDIDRVLLFFKKTLSFLQKRQIDVLAIDPNLGMWHPLVPDADKPGIQKMIIDHIPVFQKIAPVFIVAPRFAGTLNIELTKSILKQKVDFIRTHDLQKLQELLFNHRVNASKF